jgi:hypothetical protein
MDWRTHRKGFVAASSPRSGRDIISLRVKSAMKSMVVTSGTISGDGVSKSAYLQTGGGIRD